MSSLPSWVYAAMGALPFWMMGLGLFAGKKK